jgi:hypothetical protein
LAKVAGGPGSSTTKTVGKTCWRVAAMASTRVASVSVRPTLTTTTPSGARCSRARVKNSTVVRWKGM